MREAPLGAYAHQDLPFEKLVEELRPERSLTCAALPGHAGAAERARRRSELLRKPSAGEPLRGASSRTANFDLSLTVGEDAGRVFGTLTYRTDLFDASIRRMVGHLIRLLIGAATDSSRPVSELPLLGKTEVHQTLEWNDTFAPLPREHRGEARCRSRSRVLDLGLPGRRGGQSAGRPSS